METIYLSDIWNVLFEGCIITDKQGYILGMNRTAKRIFSISSDMEGVSIDELLPQDLQIRNQKKITQVRYSFGTEELLMNYKPLEQADLYIFKRINELENLKQEVKRKKHELNNFYFIADLLEEGICAIDADGNITFYNKKMGEFDIVEPEKVRGKPLTAVFGENSDKTKKLWNAFHAGKKLNHRETAYTTDGSKITAVSHIQPIYNGKTKAGAVQILKDITKQKNLEDMILKFKEKENRRTRRNNQAKNNTTFTFDDIIYSSEEMESVVEQAKRCSRTSSNILLIGETGTGKELFAQSIHNESPRSNYRFIAQNCAAVPETLLEGLLFGTTAGSFTGAVDRPGIFEQADKGTLLLDEINSMSLNLQAKLLRVIQEKQVQRIGSSKSIHIDVRIIATINEDPHQAIAKGRLREDLYYRLSVVNLEIPPLRTRKKDIAILTDYFLKKHCRILHLPPKRIDRDLMECFYQYHWPGNVRQLEHSIEGALNIIEEEETIQHYHLPSFIRNKITKSNSLKQRDDMEISPENGTLEEQVSRLETALIQQALREADGNLTKTGKILGISRQNLHYKMKKYNLLQKANEVK